MACCTQAQIICRSVGSEATKVAFKLPNLRTFAEPSLRHGVMTSPNVRQTLQALITDW